MTMVVVYAIILYLMLCASGFGGFSIFQTIKNTIASAAINVAGLSPGTQTVNGLAPSCFTNPADVVSANTTWTPLSTQYLAAPTNQQYVVLSISACNARDTELTTWTRQGYVYLRLDDLGNAVYFLHNGNSTNGTLEIGIVTGLNESSYPGGTYFPLYSNIDLVSSVAGYSKTDTTGASFTFGVSGFDIYAKFNGTEILRFQEYRQMNQGSAALKSAGAGFRTINYQTLNRKFLYSQYNGHQINLADWNINSFQTTGSISASSNSLTVASAAGLHVGDFVVVEIGNEAGAGLRGTIGVGGVWPALHYTTTANLLAGTPATNTFAWADDTGDTYNYFNLNLVSISNGSPAVFTIGSNTLTTNALVTFRTTGTLPSPLVADTVYYVINAGQTATTFEVSATLGGPAINTTTAGSGTHRLSWVKTNPWASVNYYPSKAVPMSLQARITGISGNTITLDTAATVAATNAKVYVDNQLIFNNLLQTVRSGLSPIAWSTMEIVVPAGSYAIGGTIFGSNHTGWTISGQSQAATTLFSPKGVRGAGMNLQAFPSLLVKNLTLTSNYGLNYFGLNFFTTLTPVPSSSQDTQYNSSGLINIVNSEGSVTQTALGGNWFPSGIAIQQSDNAIVQDVTINDVFTNAVQCQLSTNCWAYRVTANINSAVQSYTQWQLEWANATNGGCQDCSINHVSISPGFEAFSSTGVQFIRPVMTNAVISLNNVGNWLLQDAVQTITTNSVGPITTPTAGTVQITANTGSDLIGPGGTVSNFNMTVQGYINASNDVPIGININSGLPNITITGGSYVAPNYAAPSTTVGPQGIISQGTNISVNGFTSCGTLSVGSPSFDHASIGLTNGSVINSTATVISAPTTSGNTTPCP